MRRGTVFIVLFIIVAALIIGASTLLQNQPALEINIAVDPLGEAWLRDAALRFNESGATIGVGRRVRVNIITRSDLNVLNNSGWTAQNKPAGWIPAWSSLSNLSRSPGITADSVVLSLARTPLVWMSPESRADKIPDLSWTGIQSAIADGTSTQLVNLAFSLPSNSAQGLGALISAAAEYHHSGVLDEEMLRNTEMRTWLAPLVQSVPNYTTVGANAAQLMAGAQGSTYDAAIAPESQWLLTLETLRTRNTPRFAYPENPVVFDFPFITLRDATTTDEQIAAAQSFAAYLMSPGQQTNLERFGLRPAQNDPQPESALFVAGARYGIQHTLPAVQAVQLPSASALQTLDLWFTNTLRAR